MESKERIEQSMANLSLSMANLSLEEGEQLAPQKDPNKQEGPDGWKRQGEQGEQEPEEEEEEYPDVQEGCLLAQLDESLILAHIFGEFLDGHTIARMAVTCKQIAAMSRDQSLWRHFCQRLWGDADKRVGSYKNDYRHMYIRRPHVRFDGFYVQENVRTKVVERDLLNAAPRIITTKYWRVVQFLPSGKCHFGLSTTPPMPGFFTRRRAWEEGAKGHGPWRANSSEVVVKASLDHITLLLKLGLTETRIGSHNRLFWLDFAGREFDTSGVLQDVHFPLPERGFEFVKE